MKNTVNVPRLERPVCAIPPTMKHLTVLLLLLATLSSAAMAQQVYRWVDKDGNVHYGDRVPPEYAEQVFGRPAEESAATPEDAAAARQAKEDRVLLMTYLSVDEIEAVRDRRIEQLQSRADVTQRYLDSLNDRLAKLQREEKLWSGRVEKGEAEAVPADVIAELASTRESIADYQGRLDNSAAEQQSIQQKFAKDIARFRELKGLPAGDDAPGADTDQADLAATAAKSGTE